MDFSEEAIYWIVKMRADDVSEDDKKKFSSWLAVSVDHRLAFDRQLDQFELLGVIPVPNTSAEHARERVWLAQLNFNLWGFSGAVSVCLLLLAVLTLPFNENKEPVLHYQTAKGESKEIRLKDGSKISLNTYSSVSVYFSEQYRSLILHRGEAYFEVAPDRERPFSVDVGDGKVVVVGTEFNIYRRDNFSEITVTEGQISVNTLQGEAHDSKSVLADAGQQVLIKSSGPQLRDTKNLYTVLDWRQQHIRFEQADLSDVVASLNRYLSEPVAVDRHELQQLKVSGGFQLQAPEASMAAIVTSLNLKIVTRGGRRLIIPAD